MKNNKGFTMIELIAVFLIIAAISTIAVVSVKGINSKLAKNYYEETEKNILLAGSEYFGDNPKDRPIDSYNKIGLDKLVSDKYIEQVLDYNGKDTCDASVYIYKNNGDFKYQSCLTCDGYSSSGDYCNNLVKGIIYINGITSNKEVYYGTLSYDNTPWIKADYVDFTFTTSNNDASKYVITNIDDGSKKDVIASGGTGKTRINKTGSYSVIAYNNKDIVVGETKYFNVKFDKSKPTFDFSNNEKEFYFDYNESSYKYSNKIINLYDDNGIKSVKYTLSGTKNYSSNTNITDKLEILHNLESGLYKLSVTVTDIAGNSTTKSIDNIKVIMPLKVIYVDLDGVENNKGYKYVVNGNRYDLIKTLAEKYNPIYDVEVEWFLDTAKKKQIYDSTIVNSSNPYVIYAYDKFIVQVAPTNSFCKSVTYDGTSHKLTKGSEVGFTFEDVKKTYYTENGYKIKATLNKGFIWDDMTLEPKYIRCNINKRNVTFTSGSTERTFDSKLHSNSKCTVNGLASTDSYVCTPTGSRKKSGTSNNTIGVLTILNGSVDASNSYNIEKKLGTIKINKRIISCTTGSATCTFDSCERVERKLSFDCSGLLSGWSVTPFVKSGARAVFTYGVGKYTGVLMDYDIHIYDSSVDDVTSDCSIGHSKGTLIVETLPIQFDDRFCNDVTFDGKSHELITLTGSDRQYVSISGQTNQINAGTYVFTAYLKDTANTMWSEGGTGSKGVRCELKKKKVDFDASCNSLTYNGNDQVLATASGDGYNISNNKQKNAGTYTVKFSLKDKINTTWSDGSLGDKSLKCTINRKKATITADNCSFIYDGNDKICGGNASCDVDGVIDEAQPNLDCRQTKEHSPGTYIVSAGGTISSNYDVKTIDGKMTITDNVKPSCSISVGSTGKLTISCNDNSKDVAWCGWTSSGSGTVSTKTITKAGTYTGYVRDGSGNTNTCSKKVYSTTEYRKATCKSYSCSNYAGYSVMSTSYVKDCSENGSKGDNATYVTCKSQTIYYGTCASRCCYGTAQNCSTSAYTSAGTGYKGTASAAKNAASCKASCPGTPLVDSQAIKSYSSTSGYKKTTYGNAACDSYSCSTWNSFGEWGSTECSSILSSSNASNLKKCEERTVFS